MKTALVQTILVIICSILIVSCRKNDTPETPVNPKEDVMSFSFAEAMLQPSGIVILTTPAELERLFIDLGDGKFVPLAENAFTTARMPLLLVSPPKAKTCG